VQNNYLHYEQNVAVQNNNNLTLHILKLCFDVPSLIIIPNANAFIMCQNIHKIKVIIL